jgi:hypothetical protein
MPRISEITKFIGGHSDLLGGVVTVREANLLGALRQARLDRWGARCSISSAACKNSMSWGRLRLTLRSAGCDHRQRARLKGRHCVSGVNRIARCGRGNGVAPR